MYRSFSGDTLLSPEMRRSGGNRSASVLKFFVSYSTASTSVWIASTRTGSMPPSPTYFSYTGCTAASPVQGIMGSYYATAAGEAPRVARAIAEHYRPRFSGDAIPTDIIGQVVALSDKIDTICGYCYGTHAD